MKLTLFFSSQKVKFVKNAILVWSATQLILQISLLFFSIPLSVFISTFFYIPMGYFFYGKNVFGYKKFNKLSLQKFILITFLLWFLNTTLTSIVHSFDINKNLSAILPMIGLFSLSLSPPHPKTRLIFLKLN